jgi:hypothetical protein
MGGVLVNLFRFCSTLVMLACTVLAVPTASAQTLEPSAEVYNDLVRLETRMQPTFNAADRFVSARAAGLSAQPGELEGIEADLGGFQDEATAIAERAHADGIDPHVGRAADAIQQEIGAFFAATYMTNLMLQSGTGTDYATGQMNSTITADLNRFTTLADVAQNEMAAYADIYKQAHGGN